MDDLGSFLKSQPRIGQAQPGHAAAGGSQRAAETSTHTEPADARELYKEENTSVYGHHSLANTTGHSTMDGVNGRGGVLTDYEHLREAMTVANLSRELVELKKSCHQLQGTCWRLGCDGCIGVCRKGGSARACWRQRLLPAALSCSCGVEWHTRIRAQGLGFRAARRDSISRAWRHKA